jgi:transcription initiation factor TFIID TATA-box-binding protein
MDPLKPNLLGSLIECPNLSTTAGMSMSGTDEAASGLLIQIQNMTATVNMGVKLNLPDIALKCRNTEYNPKKFGAVIMRLREPKTTCLLFSSGKCVITGARSSHNASLAARKFAYILNKLSFSNRAIDFKMENIIATTDVGFPVRLEGILFAHAKFASYEPELFPGLIYRMLSPKVVLLIFVSGKVVITGAKNEKHLAAAMEKIHPTLEEYKKTTLTQEQQDEQDRIAKEKEKQERGQGQGGEVLRIGDGSASATTTTTTTATNNATSSGKGGGNNLTAKSGGGRIANSAPKVVARGRK